MESKLRGHWIITHLSERFVPESNSACCSPWWTHQTSIQLTRWSWRLRYRESALTPSRQLERNPRRTSWCRILLRFCQPRARWASFSFSKLIFRPTTSWWLRLSTHQRTSRSSSGRSSVATRRSTRRCLLTLTMRLTSRGRQFWDDSTKSTSLRHSYPLKSRKV